MKAYQFDVRAFATVTVWAETERQAREALHGYAVDCTVYDTQRDGTRLILTAVSADDGEPELVAVDGDVADEE